MNWTTIEGPSNIEIWSLTKVEGDDEIEVYCKIEDYKVFWKIAVWCKFQVLRRKSEEGLMCLKVRVGIEVAERTKRAYFP